MLKSQLDGANSQLGKVQLELSESRSTAWKRKEEIDAMTKQVNTEKAQVRALKADIDYKIKATKQLEETIDGMQTRHWDKEREAENTRLELERKQREKTDEAEQL